MNVFRPLRLTAACAALLAAGTFTSALLAAPQDTCLPALGCVTTSVPTLPVTVPTLPTTTTTAGTTTTDGGPTAATGIGSPTSTAATTTGAEGGAPRPVPASA
jgi:hypothetical protein